MDTISLSIGIKGKFKLYLILVEKLLKGFSMLRVMLERKQIKLY